MGRSRRAGSMLRQSAPYGVGPSSFAAGLAGGAVPFGSPAAPASLNVPFAVTSGPSGKGALPSLDTPFAVGGFYNSSATAGWPTNNTVPHHYLAMQNQHDGASRARLADLCEGMIVFARNPQGVAQTAGRLQPGSSQRFDAPESANTVEMLEVNQLNDWLAEKSADYYKSADELLHEWQLLGVVKVEVAPKRSSSFDQRNTTSRILNLIVSGRVAVVNLFGAAQAGDALYFLVKQEHTPQKGRKWVVRPHVCANGTRPGPADLVGFKMTPDKDGNYPELNDYSISMFGRPVYVGVVQDSSTGSGETRAPLTFATTSRELQRVRPLVIQFLV